MRHRIPSAVLAILISPAAHAQTQDSPSCLAAIQVIGHSGEKLLADWNLVGELGHPMDATLAIATGAGLYLQIASKVVANDQAQCDRVNKKLERTYPARLDEHDHMSAERLMSVLAQLRIVASTKAQLQAESSRDISH